MKHSALNYALWLLGKRDHTIGEIKEKLAKKDYPREEIRETITFLVEKNFLDDERFAKNFIRNQLAIKPVGKYQLRMKLKKKLVPDELIETKLESVKDEGEKKLAKEAAEKWQKRKNYELGIMNYAEEQKYKDKLARHLVGRGFSWNIVKETLDKFQNHNYK